MRRPLWYYGLLFLMAAVLPSLLLKPPENAQAAASRFVLQIVVSAIGFALIGWHVVRARRQNRMK